MSHEGGVDEPRHGVRLPLALPDVDPHPPVRNAEEEARAKPFMDKLEAFLRRIDSEEIDRVARERHGDGGDPDNISYMTAPRLKMSVRSSTLAPFACSGDM